eukprot:CAMPEP_0117454610 /NCGR_PEP_ID=MMETSP0759-20121206/10892_1 /TAXON_ID=63605 /ORGANISM="Percolomonas cosmopolitus, Strain WS" /LENGTH=172 /DNA_ID=CAMNT_0005247807 /DNA_START=192 /DNA_END=710 /DNA_ORIENTATION=+
MQQEAAAEGGIVDHELESASTIIKPNSSTRKSFFEPVIPSLSIMDHYLTDCFLYILPFVSTRHTILTLLKKFISGFEENYQRHHKFQFACDFSASLASYMIIYPAHCFVSRFTVASMTGFESQYDHVDLALMHSKPGASLYTGFWSGVITFSAQYLLYEGLNRYIMRRLVQR